MTAPEKLQKPVTMSLLLHAGIVVFLWISPKLFAFKDAESWGGVSAGDGVKVKLVGAAAGIALPLPEVTKDDAAANESKGFFKAEPAPEAPPTPEKAVPIPAKNAPLKKAPAKPSKAPPAVKNTQPAPTQPMNAVPYGQGGNPSIQAGNFSTQPGVGSQVGEGGAFGSKYSEYVSAMNRKISQNWLKGLVDSSIQRAPRVYLTFDILRDGTITNIELTQSSNIPTLDNSAKRALYASNKLPPLPADYPGASVRVSYYFEYIK